jgi:hypothetical protein
MEAAADADGKGVFGWLRSLVRGTKRLPASPALPVSEAPSFEDDVDEDQVDQEGSSSDDDNCSQPSVPNSPMTLQADEEEEEEKDSHAQPDDQALRSTPGSADTSVDQAPDYDGCNSQEILSPSPSGEEPAQATPRPPEPSQPAAKHVVTIDEDKSVEAPPLDATEIDHQAAMPTVVYHSSLDERTVQLLHVLCGSSLPAPRPGQHSRLTLTQPTAACVMLAEPNSEQREQLLGALVDPACPRYPNYQGLVQLCLRWKLDVPDQALGAKILDGVKRLEADSSIPSIRDLSGGATVARALVERARPPKQPRHRKTDLLRPNGYSSAKPEARRPRDAASECDLPSDAPQNLGPLARGLSHHKRKRNHSQPSRKEEGLVQSRLPAVYTVPAKPSVSTAGPPWPRIPGQLQDDVYRRMRQLDEDDDIQEVIFQVATPSTTIGVSPAVVAQWAARKSPQLSPAAKKAQLAQSRQGARCEPECQC